MNPVWTILPPLAVIPFIIIFGEKRSNARESAIIIAGAVLFLLNYLIYQNLTDNQPSMTAGFRIMPGLSVEFSAEPIGVMFGLMASFLWVITTVYSIGYMRGHDEQHQSRFYCCFAVALSAVMAVSYSGNLLTLFIAYEVLSLSTYPLVTHSGTEKAKQAGRIYLGMLMGTSFIFLLPAIIWTYSLTGTLDFTPGGVFSTENATYGQMGIILILFVFGISKAAVMPFHKWLPRAMVAPTPVSALLHAVAVVKTGVFSILKISVYIFGVDKLNGSDAVNFLLVFAAATILLASLMAIRQNNLKARLAYSTVSQLSYIVMAALIASQLSAMSGSFHIVTHAFAKITLFFCAGVILVAVHKTEISDLDGLGKTMPVTMAAFLIASIGIIGIPPVAGFWSKLMLAQSTVQTDQVWLLIVLMVSTLLNIAYLMPIPIRAFFRPPRTSNGQTTLKEGPITCVCAIVVTTFVCLGLFIYPDPIVELLNLIQWQ